jgi:hypothetical protein
VPDKEIYVVPVDPQAYGVGVALGCLLRFWPVLVVIACIGLAVAGGVYVVRSGVNLVRYGVASEEDVQQRAAATQVADQTAGLLAEAKAAIADGDYYNAAAILRNILSTQPDNQEAQQQFAQIAGRVQGGLTTGRGYFPLGPEPAVSMPYLPMDTNRIVGVSLDGQRALLIKTYNNSTIDLLNLATGSLETYIETQHAIPSPDLAHYIETFSGRILYGWPANQVVSDLPCIVGNADVLWMRDGKTITGVDGNTSTVAWYELDTGRCQSISVPGVGWGTDVIKDGDRLYIITPGDYRSQNYGDLFIANLDGSGLTKLADLPIAGRDDTPALLSPDGSAVYVNGLMISTRTGRISQSIEGVIGWIDAPFPEEKPYQVTLSVTPSEGPRATRFSFRVQGGLGGQEVYWAVNPSPNMAMATGAMVAEYTNLDQNGSRDDSHGKYGWNTDINTEAQEYYLTIYVNRAPVGEVGFRVVEGGPPVAPQAPAVTPLTSAPQPGGDQAYLIASVASGLCLDVPEAALYDVELIQWGCFGGVNQQWLLVDRGDGFVNIVGKQSEKCLDVPKASTEDNVRVIQYGCTGDDNQGWQLVAVQDGVFQIVAKHSGKCLATEDGGSGIVQQGCTAAAGQRWILSLAP